MAYVQLYARLVLTGIFVLSAGSKLSATRSQAFARGIERLAGVPGRWSATLGRATIGLELAIAVLVAVPSTAAVGLWLAAVTLVGFALVLLRAVRAGVAESCHCFGASDQPVGPRHVARTTVLAVLAVAGGAAAGATGVPAPGVALTALVAAVSIAAAVLLDDLVSLFTHAPAPRPAGSPG